MDILDRAVQMHTGFLMHRNIGSLRGHKAVDILIRSFDHQMYIVRQGSLPVQGIHDRRAEADIRYKMSVHDLSLIHI